MFQIRNCLTRGLVAGALASAARLPVPAAEAASERVVYSFCSQTNCADGESPQAALINVGGTLYGTTETGGANNFSGTVFKINATTGAETVVYSFCSQAGCTDGEYPEAALINVKGTLYGTTYEGGAKGGGTVFKINPTTGVETVVYSFCSQTNCADGDYPLAGLINVKGTLYGTTYEGGTDDAGTVFKVSPKDKETVLYSFKSGSDGAAPYGSLIDVKDTLYGTTSGSGANGGGTVFKINPTTGAEKVVYSFCSQTNCADGDYPLAGLINVKGTLYGTTYEGGANNSSGTVFKINPTTGAETVVYSFCSQASCADGGEPQASLINVKGTLYGTSVEGGAKGYGAVFKINPTTGAEKVVYSLCSQASCTDGYHPEAALINVGGTLYGTTVEGGARDDGTVYKVTLP